MPYQASRWRKPFQASVATRSPSVTPSLREALGDAQRAIANLPVIAAMHRPFDGARHDFAAAILDRREIDDLMQQQRPILHQSRASSSSLASRPTRARPKNRRGVKPLRLAWRSARSLATLGGKLPGARCVDSMNARATRGFAAEKALRMADETGESDPLQGLVPIDAAGDAHAHRRRRRPARNRPLGAAMRRADDADRKGGRQPAGSRRAPLCHQGQYFRA